MRHTQRWPFGLAEREKGICRADSIAPLPVLEGGPSLSRLLYWRMSHRGQRALRDGRWKYPRVDGIDHLFGVEAD